MSGMTSEKMLDRLRNIEKGIVIILMLVSAYGVFRFVFGYGLEGLTVGWVVVVFLFLLIVLLSVQRVVDHIIEVGVAFTKHSDNEKFKSLYDSSPTAYVTVDSKGKVVMSNPSAARLLNCKITEIPGLNFFDIVIEHEGHDASMLPGKVQGGATLADEELLLRTRSGNDVWVLMSAFEDKHNHQHIFSLVDITEAKKVDAAKSEFVALATHQLRTPVAAIRWNYELLAKKIPSEAKVNLEKYLEKISRNTQRMISLIDDFLSVSKLEMGTYATSKEAVDLSQFCSDVIDEFAGKIEEKQIKVTRNEEPPAFTFTTDTALFHIIVSNLVSNAVKYLKASGSLDLSYKVSGDNLVISVTDDGIGIPEDELDNLFTKFFRASNARSHHTSGTGLGLYIIQQSVEQLGGTISVESVEDVKTTFTVTLPTS